MTALALPVTVSTAILVMAAQGAGRIVPLAPVSAGLRIAMLTYGFVEVTDRAVDIGDITSFWFVVGAVHLIASFTIAIGVIVVSFKIRSPRHALTSVIAAARSATETGGSARPAQGQTTVDAEYRRDRESRTGREARLEEPRASGQCRLRAVYRDRHGGSPRVSAPGECARSQGVPDAGCEE
jgi:hypothetical protein